nr:prepilin peptidase [uncultured Niameybacter sp.]
MLHTDFYLSIYVYGLAIILGSIFGSFINCMSWRIVHGESVWKGRSHCTSCGHVLHTRDLVPILSYVFLRGECRYCKEKVSIRYVFIEILLVVVFISFIWKYGISFLTLRYLVLACILLGLALVDFDSYEIPDGFIMTGIFWWLITIPFIDNSIVEQLKTGLLGGGAIGGGVLMLSLLMDKLLKKESMGGGDIKLFFMLGLYMGPALSLFNLNISCILGIFIVVLMKKNRIPFGPAIVGASWITFLWGGDIVSWYWELFI